MCTPVVDPHSFIIIEMILWFHVFYYLAGLAHKVWIPPAP